MQNGYCLQKTFWNVISWHKIVAFWLKFHHILYLMPQSYHTPQAHMVCFWSVLKIFVWARLGPETHLQGFVWFFAFLISLWAPYMLRDINNLCWNLHSSASLHRVPILDLTYLDSHTAPCSAYVGTIQYPYRVLQIHWPKNYCAAASSCMALVGWCDN